MKRNIEVIVAIENPRKSFAVGLIKESIDAQLKNLGPEWKAAGFSTSMNEDLAMITIVLEKR